MSNKAPAPAEDRVIERPDGFYWIHGETGKEYGPFTTLEAAENDREYSAESDYEPGESLAEAESELGISDWVDPDTGELAEFSSRLEDH